MVEFHVLNALYLKEILVFIASFFASLPHFYTMSPYRFAHVQGSYSKLKANARDSSPGGKKDIIFKLGLALVIARKILNDRRSKWSSMTVCWCVHVVGIGWIITLFIVLQIPIKNADNIL